MSQRLTSTAAVSSASRSSGFRFKSVGRTDRGLVRKLNEDSYIQSPDTALWAVADGMGGHQSGDVASDCVVRRLASVQRAASAYALRNEVVGQLTKANEDVLTLARDTAGGRMGSTVAVLTACQGYYSCTWAGDSRIYLLRKGNLRRITTDHSVVQALIDAGEISYQEAQRHSRAHVVTRAVGAGPGLSLDTVNGELQEGDRFLLCTDGLTSVLDDARIFSLITHAPLGTALDNLISHTLEKGAPDNVTVVLTDVLG